MDFNKELVNYMKILKCSTKDICNASGISYSLINRYINGKRTPKDDGKNFDKLVEAIYQISLQKNINLTKDSIYNTLKKALTGNTFHIDFNMLIDNINKLQEKLSITTVDLSRAIGYDSSFVSRIKNKERKPANIENFIDKIRTYIIFVISQNGQKKNDLVNLLNCSEDDLQDINNFKEIFSEWLCSKHIDSRPDDIQNFLTKLDTFNLNDYIRTDFDKVKVTTVPTIIKSSKSFFGIEGRKKAESQFLITTLLSKSDEPIFFYNDLPIAQAGEDENFKKSYVLAMTKLLKKGLHLNMVHNLNRPINELLLGLENWIPMYMTGSISPYYFKNPPSNFFQVCHYTSGSVALNSECIKYNEKKSKFYLTTKKDEVEFEKEKSKYMLSKATPLMKIYKEQDKSSFDEFMDKYKDKNIRKIKKDIFNNIDFYINEDKWIIINKEKAPEIHFVIYHEKLVNAIQTFLLTQ